MLPRLGVYAPELGAYATGLGVYATFVSPRGSFDPKKPWGNDVSDTNTTFTNVFFQIF